MSTSQSFSLPVDALFLIAGPCVIESEDLCLAVGEKLAELGQKHGCTIIFKASYDKSNRTSKDSFRGPGREEGLKILEKTGVQTGLPLLTDIHLPEDAREAAQVVDVIQIPAFLCRQTDLLLSAAQTGKHVNIKKGPFMAPADMHYAVEKVGSRAMLTERGTFFGYNRLVVDYAGIHAMKRLGVPVIFDATHSVQSPGGGGDSSTGERALAVPLACAAVCQRVDGLFFEVHPDPAAAWCDGPNSLELAAFERSLPRLLELDRTIRQWHGA